MINSLIVSTLLITFSTSMGGIQTQFKTAYSQAVDLIEINSGNQSLDSGLPAFYDCIDEKIDESKGAEEDDYFEKEPTKNEVKTCYSEVFLGETPLDIDNDEQDLDLGGQ
ncbi:MAG TPA: hypothetical protein VJR94_11105 [Candidatus Nitrosocosmicus sp.]|nr:hypothetical protein [Candidatus Nitrosocosmicus sp.]